MIRFLSNGKTLETGRVEYRSQKLFSELRETLEMDIAGSSYNELNSLFVDGAAFEIVDDTGAYNKSMYSVAGPITDNKNGTFTVIMGVKSAGEVMSDLLDGLVADKVITASKKAQIIEERLPKKEVIVNVMNAETGEIKRDMQLRSYIEG